jgi:hypothetical protein
LKRGEIMKRLIAFSLVSAALLCSSCGTDHANLPTEFIYAAPPTPTNLAAAPAPERCALSWSYPAGSMSLVREFRVYQCYEAYGIVQLIGTTADTAFVDSLLVGNLYYCYTVSAVDTTGLEGWRADAVCAFVPTGP